MRIKPLQIKAYRQRLGLTQTEFADMAGVSQPTVRNKWEKLGIDSKEIMKSRVVIDMFVAFSSVYPDNYEERFRKSIEREQLRIVWDGMKQRCFNSKNPAYKYYGGRGIKVCHQWLNNFDKFYLWGIENGYGSHLTIDRIDNDGDYHPSNCRWATMKQQNNNKRNNRKKKNGK